MSQLVLSIIDFRRLIQDSYRIGDDAARPVYYAALDCFTSMFVQKTHPAPTSLIQAYVEAEKVSLQSPETTNGALNYFGNTNTLNQGALSYTLTINPVPTPPNQLVLHPGAPMSQAVST